MKAKIEFNATSRRWMVEFSDGFTLPYMTLSSAHTTATAWEKWAADLVDGEDD